MLGLGQPWIQGYKPQVNFQLSLVDAVLRHLDQNRGVVSSEIWNYEFEENRNLYIGAAPTFSNEAPTIDPERMAAISRKYDVAKRDEQNRKLEEAGEFLVFQHERSFLKDCGREDLSKQVVWTAKEIGDGAGYDIQSFEPNGGTRLIEVKTTNGWSRTPFHISRNEIKVSEENRDTWVLMRLYNYIREPQAFEIRPPLEAHVKLTPTSFLASIGWIWSLAQVCVSYLSITGIYTRI